MIGESSHDHGHDYAKDRDRNKDRERDRHSGTVRDTRSSGRDPTPDRRSHSREKVDDHKKRTGNARDKKGLSSDLDRGAVWVTYCKACALRRLALSEEGGVVGSRCFVPTCRAGDKPESSTEGGSLSAEEGEDWPKIRWAMVVQLGQRSGLV